MQPSLAILFLPLSLVDKFRYYVSFLTRAESLLLQSDCPVRPPVNPSVGECGGRGRDRGRGRLANPQQIRQHQLSSATAVTAMAQKDKSGKSRFRSSVIASGGAEDQHVFLLPTGMFLEHFLAANRSPGRVS